MKVLVTGGAGYIGSIMVPVLLESGHKVTVLDNFMYKQHSLLDHVFNKNLTIIKGDSRDKELIKYLVPRHDVLIPLAAIVGMPACKNNPSLAKEVNSDAIQMLVSAAGQEQMILFPNTNSGYGQGEGAVFTEESELNPISVYGITKVEAENRVREHKNSVIFRLATVFGVSPKMRLDLLVNDFTWKAWWDHYITLFESHFKRNYIHIRDVAGVFNWSIANWDKVSGEVYNFGLSNANLSKKELCEKIQTHIPDFHITEYEMRKDPDQRNYIVLNDKIEKTGYIASISVDQGIQELIKSFQILQPNIYSNLL